MQTSAKRIKLQPSLELSLSDCRLSLNFNDCIICQLGTKECLTSPKKSNSSTCGYELLIERIKEFNIKGVLPVKYNHLLLLDIDTLRDNSGLWHKSCRKNLCNYYLPKPEEPILIEAPQPSIANERQSSRQSNESCNVECFLCEKSEGKMRMAKSLELEKNVISAARITNDKLLLSKMNLGGDLVSNKCMYHLACLTNLYNQEKKCKSLESNNNNYSSYKSLAFSDLINFIKYDCINFSMPLQEIHKLYLDRLENLGYPIEDAYNHITKFKEKILSEIPSMLETKKGRNIILSNPDAIQDAVNKVANHDSDDKILVEAAKIIRRDLSVNDHLETELQSESVPTSLLSLVTMILDGSGLNKLINPRQSALTIAQLIKFNSTKRIFSKSSSPMIHHHKENEPPIVRYVGNMIHAHTRSKDLINKLAALGLCIGYDRVLQISTNAANSVSILYNKNNVVCPPHLPSNQFVTGAFDNIDHDPSSATTKTSFHGTALSLHTHPSNIVEEIKVRVLETSVESVGRTIERLPINYTQINEIINNTKARTTPVLYNVQETNDKLEEKFNEMSIQEIDWIDNIKKSLDKSENCKKLNISWPAFHADRTANNEHFVAKTGLLPLFREKACTASMANHAMKLVSEATEFLNPGQTPIIACDQPLYALCKQLQWTHPNKYGEDKLVVMKGGLHLELASLKAIGCWLKGSEWDEIIADAGIASVGTAESFLKCAHITKTRHAHQVTAAALSLLIDRAYDNDHQNEDIETWTKIKCLKHPTFNYWHTTLLFERSILLFVRSLREEDFNLYIASLENLVPWFFALDRTHYSRWTSVHIKDMNNLKFKNPEVLSEFEKGKFVVHRTKNAFSAMALDQCHEQLNACIKGDGGAIGITENSNALLRWKLAGPEISRSLQNFEELNLQVKSAYKNLHHEQSQSIQNNFLKEVNALLNAFEEIGNPFQEDSADLISLKSKTIFDLKSKQSVDSAYSLGKSQYDAFVENRLVNCNLGIMDTIPQNKLPLLSTKPNNKVSAMSKKLKIYKNDTDLFSRLYIASQHRPGDLDEFFKFENQPFPPSISDNGNLRLGQKSDILSNLETLHDSEIIENHECTVAVLDGGTIIHMLNVGFSKTFKEYFTNVFLTYIKQKLLTFDRIDIIWDRYDETSLKSFTRSKRGGGSQQKVEGHIKLPKSWVTFLQNDYNKTSLFKFITNELSNVVFELNKIVVCTNGQSVVYIGKPLVYPISKCDHEEADSRIFVHVLNAIKNDHTRVAIRTVDSDILILAIAVASKNEINIFIEFGTGTNFRVIAAHSIANALGPMKSITLPLFHAFTGCDTTSSFAGRAKKRCWESWLSFPDFTGALKKICDNPKDFLNNEIFAIIERYVILIYEKSSQLTDIHQARKELFCHKSGLKNMFNIPPTRDALIEHLKRSIYQACFIWNKCTEAELNLPDATDWGWTLSEGKYIPCWITGPEIFKATEQLVKCGCLLGCNNRCSCNKANLPCTSMCKCNGNCNQ